MGEHLCPRCSRITEGEAELCPICQAEENLSLGSSSSEDREGAPAWIILGIGVLLGAGIGYVVFDSGRARAWSLVGGWLIAVGYLIISGR